MIDMKGYIQNFTRGKDTSKNNAVIVRLDGVKDRDSAQAAVGKKVTTPGARGVLGRVASPHGNNGAVKVVFRKPLPGQAVSAKVSVV